MFLKLKSMSGIACALLCGLSLSTCILGQAPGQNPNQDLPDGKGKAEFIHNCTACHRADMVTAVKKTPEDWKKSVFEMASRGTDGTEEDLNNVVLYLDKFYALDKPASDEGKPSTATPSHPNGSAALNPFDIERVRRLVASEQALGR